MKVVALSDAIAAHVAPEMHLHFASTPSRSNAAIREVARAYLDRQPRFRLSSTGFHSMAHLLPALGLADRLTACFYGDHYPAPRPNPLYTRLQDTVAIEHWPLWTMIAALRAGAQGDDWAINRSLRGTTMAAELAARGAYRELPELGLGLVAALRPDVTFVHAAASDAEGHVLFAGPRSEGVWSALAAKRGVIVTVERIVSDAVTRAHPEAIALPPHRVLAVCEEPFGAHPQPLMCPPEVGAGYRDDFEDYERWRTLPGDAAALAAFVARVLRAPDAGAAYRAEVGDRLAELEAPKRRAIDNAAPRARPAPDADTAPVDALIIAGAHQLAARARAIGAEVVIAGIGHAFFAARLAQLRLAAEGHALRVMVETGLYDVDCGPDGHGYLLAYDNWTRARRLTAIDDILGVLAGGADNRCLAALGAAQIDRHGNLNSTRLGDKLLVGSGGACDIAALAHESVVLTRLVPGRLVDEVAYITSPGHRVRSIVTEHGVLARGDSGWAIASVTRDPALDTAAFTRACPWPLQPTSPPVIALADDARLLATLDPTGTFRHRG